MPAIFTKNSNVFELNVQKTAYPKWDKQVKLLWDNM
jgi:hypothetical protein